jgi:hypothetical protein
MARSYVHEVGQRGFVMLSALVLALASVTVVVGCAATSTTTSAVAGSATGPATSVRTQAASTPTTASAPAGGPPISLILGMSQIAGGVPVFGTSSPAGPIAVGTVSGQKVLPALWSLVSGPTWTMQEIDKTERWPLAVCELDSQSIVGDRLVVVGQDARDAGATTPENSFAAVRLNGDPWVVEDMDSRVPAGNSLELCALGATGDPTDINTFLMAVGARKKGAPAAQYLIDDITGAVPISLITVNGAAWNPAVDLPLPDGVTAAEATSVTYCGPNTPAPGVVAVGFGQTSDPTLGTRRVGIVWQSTDQGATWKVISGDSFSQPGTNLTAQFVAADSTHIEVVGQMDITGTTNSAGDTKQGMALWSIATNGSWTRGSDNGGGSDTSISTEPTALAARPGGGFLMAAQMYLTSAGPTLPGGDLSSHVSVALFSLPNGGKWSEISDSVPNIDKGAIVNGIAESDNQVIFLGMDASGAGASWAVDGSAIK